MVKPNYNNNHNYSLKQKTKKILALETSCDETAASVLEVDFNRAWPKIKILSSIIKSQISIHKSFGGVVPEAAARAHVKWIRPVVEKALLTTHYSLPTIDYIAVTVGPGLLPSLMVGVEFAKALSFATGKPMIPVNHMMGHLYSPFGREFPISLPRRQAGNFQFPNISLIVSGGHTILVLMRDIKNYKVLGQTIDDAAGEAFDKVAKMLSLPYPGGPEVSKLAKDGNPRAINFPRPMISHKNYNFSFSGLKTAVLYYLRDNGICPPPYYKGGLGGVKNKGFPPEADPCPSGRRAPLAEKIKDKHVVADVCASFQQAVVDVLVAKTLRAAQEFKARSISLSGGVAANRALRDGLNIKRQSLNVKFFVPPKNLCTDNAEMIGLVACFMLHNGFKPVNFKKVKANPNLNL